MKRALLFIGFVLFSALRADADSGGNVSGLALLRNSGARANALGEAFVSVGDDITAMDFNPASLASLESGQISLQYERGMFDDAFSKVMLGTRPGSKGILGLSVGYYTSGKTNLYDGIHQQSVTAEEDRIASVGYGVRIKSVAVGASVKYLSSDLAESASGSAGSFDVGLQYEIRPRLRLGVSGPLAQSKIQYAKEKEDLPRVYRAGMGWNTTLPLATGNLPLQLLFDVPYDSNQHTTMVALGAETYVGIMALRLGFNTRSDVQQFSIGTGFRFQRMNLDYSFGMVNNSSVDSLQKITFSLRFGDYRADALPKAVLIPEPKKKDDPQWTLDVESESPATRSKTPSPEEIQQEAIKYRSAIPVEKTTYQIYEVKEGETIESITRHRYGANANWRDVFAINKHLFSTPEEIKPGSKILLPVKLGS